MDANELLLGGAGGRYFPFLDLGAEIVGTVVGEPEATVQTDPDGSVKTFDDGTPRPMVKITLQTDLREDDEDDGLRRIYAKGEMTKAIGKAMREAGMRKIEEDGKLWVRYNGELTPKQKGWHPTKLFVAKYKAPERNAASDVFEQASAEPAWQQPAQAAPQQQAMSTLQALRQGVNHQGRPQSDEPPF